MNGYTLDQCARYAMKSPTQLAARLGRSQQFINDRANRPVLYRVWDEKKKGGGVRKIEAPRPDLKAIQKRIATLLQRVLPPEYLYSPVKGRSYVENALAHRDADEVSLLDISDYFGNCKAPAVYRFFGETMKCAPHVAWLLTGLTTREGHLPQGSPCSPILSFYTCLPMWQKIARLVSEAGCKLTVYVDDITVSGSHIPRSLIWQVKCALRASGHAHSPSKERRHNARAAEITGIIVARDKVCVPHRHYKKMQDARLASLTAIDESDRAHQRARARSLEGQVQRIKILSSLD